MKKLIILAYLLIRQSYAFTNQQLRQHPSLGYVHCSQSHLSLHSLPSSSHRNHRSSSNRSLFATGTTNNQVLSIRKSLYGCNNSNHNYDYDSPRQRSTVLYTDIPSRVTDLNTQYIEKSLSSLEQGELCSIKLSEEEQYKKEKRRMKKRNNRIKVSLAVSSLLTAFFALIYVSGSGQWRYYLAGGLCAAVSHAVTTPVDVIKTRKQVDESMKDMGLIQSGIKIIKDDKEGGLDALFVGLGPTTIGYLFEGAVKFGIYEVCKPLVRSFLRWSAMACNMLWLDSKIIGFIISGSLAGLAASIMLCPMEALRIRLVAEPEFAATGNWVDCGIKMTNDEGIMGLWKCLPSMLFKQVPYTVTKNVSFDLITTSAYSAVSNIGMTICGRTKIVIPLVSAMIASVLSCLSSQPGDMLLSVINAHKGKLTTRDHVKSILKGNGIGGFFIGIQERFVHVGLIVTLQLLIYDFVKRLVGIGATGM